MRFFILEPGRKQFTSAVPLNEIKKGDVLALEKGKNKATKFFLGENRFIELRPEGLTQEEVVLIAKYKKEKKKVFVHQTIPFAPFIFIGALLSILTKSNIIIYLLNLL